MAVILPMPPRVRATEGQKLWVRIVKVWPLTSLPILWYALVALFTAAARGPDGGLAGFEARFMAVEGRGGVAFTLSWGEALLAVSLGFLFAELVRTVRASKASIWNHSLSMLAFILGLVLFLVTPAFQTGLFFLILLITLVDFGAGFIISTISAQREVAYNAN